MTPVDEVAWLRGFLDDREQVNGVLVPKQLVDARFEDPSRIWGRGCAVQKLTVKAVGVEGIAL